jgi:hypothetical protein
MLKENEFDIMIIIKLIIIVFSNLLMLLLLILGYKYIDVRIGVLVFVIFELFLIYKESIPQFKIFNRVKLVEGLIAGVFGGIIVGMSQIIVNQYFKDTIHSLIVILLLPIIMLIIVIIVSGAKSK